MKFSTLYSQPSQQFGWPWPGLDIRGDGGFAVVLGFVPVAQYPLDSSSANTGKPGIMVFHDPAPTQTTPAHSQAPLGSFGTADFAVQGRTMNATAILKGLVDAPTELVVTTTVGNEIVPCFETAGQAYCIGMLMGNPLIGGVTLLGNGQKVVAKGKVAQLN